MNYKTVTQQRIRMDFAPVLFSTPTLYILYHPYGLIVLVRFASAFLFDLQAAFCQWVSISYIFLSFSLQFSFDLHSLYLEWKACAGNSNCLGNYVIRTAMMSRLNNDSVKREWIYNRIDRCQKSNIFGFFNGWWHKTKHLPSFTDKQCCSILFQKTMALYLFWVNYSFKGWTLIHSLCYLMH